MKQRLLFGVIAASFIGLIASMANAQSAKKPEGQQTGSQICAKLKRCVERGMSGNNQNGQRYDRATATSWCNANGYGC